MVVARPLRQGCAGQRRCLSALVDCVEVMVCAATGESLAGACRPAAAAPVGVAILPGGAVVFMCIIDFRIELFGRKPRPVWVGQRRRPCGVSPFGALL